MSPSWDFGLIAFGWVPFYVWVVAVLGLGAEVYGGSLLQGKLAEQATATAILGALAFSFVHRHYTFVLVYGDSVELARRQRAYVLAPLLILAGLVGARALGSAPFAHLSGVPINAWQVVLVVTGAWNIWHTLAQRYGIGRIYAAKVETRSQDSAHSLTSRANARLDRAVLWLAAGSVAVALPVFRLSLLRGHPNAVKLRKVLTPVVQHAGVQLLAIAVIVAFVIVLALWLRAQFRATPSWAALAPRLSLMGSTLLMFAVFLIHGPVLGYLCFGTAHAIEYIAFVHAFGAKKFAAQRQQGAPGSVASWLMEDRMRGLLLVGGGLAALFWLVADYRKTDVYLVAYTCTSWLHFLYDGWIWKVRRPEVAKPLGVRSVDPMSASKSATLT